MIEAAGIGGFEALRLVKSGLKGLLDKKIDSEVQEAIRGVLQQLDAAQENAFELREERIRLADENRGLKEQIREFENWEARAKGYVLTQTEGGATVYASEGPPPHYACPSCFERRNLEVLQNRRVVAGIFDCPGCKTEFRCNPKGKSSPIHVFSIP